MLRPKGHEINRILHSAGYTGQEDPSTEIFFRGISKEDERRKPMPCNGLAAPVRQAVMPEGEKCSLDYQQRLD